MTTDGVPITQETDENWEFLMGVNARGVFNCLRAELGVVAEGGSVVSLAIFLVFDSCSCFFLGGFLGVFGGPDDGMVLIHADGLL